MSAIDEYKKAVIDHEMMRTFVKSIKKKKTKLNFIFSEFPRVIYVSGHGQYQMSEYCRSIIRNTVQNNVLEIIQSAIELSAKKLSALKREAKKEAVAFAGKTNPKKKGK